MPAAIPTCWRSAAARLSPPPASPCAEKPARGEDGGRRAAPSEPKRQLSFKDKHALEKLPGEIEALQKEIAGLSAKPRRPALLRLRPGGVRTASATALKEAEAALATAEDEWLRLAMLGEEIDG